MIAHGDATEASTTKTASVTAAPISHAAQTNIALVHATTPVVMATSVTTVLQTVRRASIAAAVAEPAEERARAAQTSRTTPRTRARAQSIRTTAAGNATPHIIIVVASATAAPTKAVGRTSSVRVHATTRVAMATSATAVLQIARQVSIAAAAAARVRARVWDAPMHLRVRHTRVRALSTRTTADGHASLPFSTKTVSVTAALIRAVAGTHTARALVIIPAATATSAIAARPIVPRASIVEVAVARAQDHARAVRTSHRIRHTRVRAR